MCLKQTPRLSLETRIFSAPVPVSGFPPVQYEGEPRHFSSRVGADANIDAVGGDDFAYVAVFGVRADEPNCVRPHAVHSDLALLSHIRAIAGWTIPKGSFERVNTKPGVVQAPCYCLSRRLGRLGHRWAVHVSHCASTMECAPQECPNDRRYLAVEFASSAQLGLEEHPVVMGLPIFNHPPSGRDLLAYLRPRTIGVGRAPIEDMDVLNSPRTGCEVQRSRGSKGLSATCAAGLDSLDPCSERTVDARHF